jgi:hypothetical protein
MHKNQEKQHKLAQNDKAKLDPKQTLQFLGRQNILSDVYLIQACTSNITYRRSDLQTAEARHLFSYCRKTEINYSYGKILRQDATPQALRSSFAPHYNLRISVNKL